MLLMTADPMLSGIAFETANLVGLTQSVFHIWLHCASAMNLGTFHQESAVTARTFLKFDRQLQGAPLQPVVSIVDQTKS